MMKQLLENEEIKAIQDYANTVSITRLGLNDHGPVHMRTVCHNALKMLSILHDAGVETSLQKEHSGSFADSVVAVMIAALWYYLLSDYNRCPAEESSRGYDAQNHHPLNGNGRHTWTHGYALHSFH